MGDHFYARKFYNAAKKYGLDVYGMNAEEKELFIQEAIQQALDIMVGKMYA